MFENYASIIQLFDLNQTVQSWVNSIEHRTPPSLTPQNIVV